jgi:hypothetical protein
MTGSILEQNLESASEAAAYTRRVLWVGAGNYWNDSRDPRFLARLLMAQIGLGCLTDRIACYEGELAAKAVPELLLIGRRFVGMPADFVAWVQEKCDREEKRMYYQQREQERVAKGASSIAIGNCEEHAAVAWVYLRDLCDRRPRPIEVMHTSDHAFVVIGREDENAIPGQPWGAGAVICDAYYNEVYPYDGRLHTRQDGAKEYKARIAK